MDIISEKAIRYFCNGAGDCFYWDESGPEPMVVFVNNAMENASDEHIPEVLRKAYNKTWSESYGYPCYIVTVDGTPFLSLIAEFGDFDLDNPTRENSLRVLVQAAADRLDKMTVCEGFKVFIPDDTSTPFCQWEVLACIPADIAATSPDVVKKAASAMDEAFKEII